MLSYNGWPASSDPAAIGINTAWEPIPGHRFPGGCKAGDVETVLTYVVRQLDARAEPIDRDAVKDEWGWFYKASANSPDLISCHSSGTAFDYNATRHPNGVRGTWTTRQVAVIREIQAECSGVVKWLGDATRTADEMHFEIRGTTAEVRAAAARIRTYTTPAPPPPIEEPSVMYFVSAKANSNVWFFEPGRRTLVNNATDRAELAKAAGISTDVAEVSDAVFAALADGRTRHQ